MPLRVAFSIGTTWIIQETRIDTLSVTAGFTILAFRVRLASDRFALNLRIADSAFGTLTHWPVVGQEAFCTLAAVARVHADSVQAGRVFLTFVITDATYK